VNGRQPALVCGVGVGPAAQQQAQHTAQRPDVCQTLRVPPLLVQGYIVVYRGIGVYSGIGIGVYRGIGIGVYSGIGVYRGIGV
jgi:hypothetical protein